MEDEAIKRAVERIKKCLALSSSSNENEATVALQKAQALMKKYGITPQQMSFSDMTNEECDTVIAKRPARHVTALCSVIADAFGVRVIIHTGSNTRCVPAFYGAKECVVIAKYCFDVCSRQLNIARRTYMKTIHKNCKPTTRIRRADLFCRGWVAAIAANLPALELEPDDRAKLSEYVAQNVGELSCVGNRSSSGKVNDADYKAFFEGKEQGCEFEVRHGVAGKSEQVLLT
ncbi:DUF2786 domain-containing protein [Vibrio furnissii]|uniref:DUF2786 domain-containing protein n=1 Tax=Vibrio furnissii TaxID=29494 RepID=UPI001C9C20D8|nr:DUF2786 domain-containing protein [Vibrio furnissii]MBY7933107.1 DUF2786 domain-containing protein [Vibrio fluvialis]MCG6230235.1 DUF2786 domain-containing protein [Vibrio furnissii]MCG6268501.1 DUF2786 domain-containing protein [Vibrio furnissii]